MSQFRSDFDVEVFYDGDCPLCLREISMLQRRDRGHRIRFTNIAAPDFQAESYGTTYSDLMARIHGRLPDGTWIEGVEVFRRLYTAVGFGWLVAPTRLWGISAVLDWGYRIFAKNRLRFTGRCQNGVCKIPVNSVENESFDTQASESPSTMEVSHQNR